MFKIRCAFWINSNHKTDDDVGGGDVKRRSVDLNIIRTQRCSSGIDNLMCSDLM